MPRPAALRAKSAVRSGDRCAEVTSISYAMPNSSSALPASRMISRSESLPITMETSGLLILRSSLVLQANLGWMRLLLERSRCNVFAVMHALEADARYRRVSILHRGREIGGTRSHTQNAASRCKVHIVAPAGGSMKYLDTRHASSLLQAGNFLSRLEGSRISSGSD